MGILQERFDDDRGSHIMTAKHGSGKSPTPAPKREAAIRIDGTHDEAKMKVSGTLRAATTVLVRMAHGEDEGEVMRDGTISSHGKRVLSHAITVLLTLALVAVFFGTRFGARRPPLAQILGRARSQAPPLPAPVAASDAAATSPASGAGAPPAPDDVLKDLDPDERNNVRIYNATNKGVVNITTETAALGFFGDETSTGTASGFVIDREGHILTNFHVLQAEEASRVAVRATLFDGSSHEARIIGADATNDVAVLSIRVPPQKLFPLKFGDSSTVMVGQKILALGNPFGLERTLTTGIVSSLDRSIKARNGRTIKGIIQTDAAINPGNSGGPLLNSRGLVIGMNTAIVSNVGQSAGISFAVPINAVARILRQLIENGRVIRADLGVTKVYPTREGLLVMALVDGGPAERAGIQPVRVKIERGPGFIRRSVDPESADLIVAVEHKRVRTVEELLTEVEKHRPGDSVRVTVIRDGQPRDIVVQLGQS
jgi:S1-C subfamily serine protease